MTGGRIIIRMVCAAVVCAIVIALASCGRKSVESGYRTNGTFTEEEVRRDLIEDYPQWKSVYLPVKIKVASEMSLSGRATLIRGEKLHISFRMLGMEVGSVYADKDSVFIADKYHKWLLAESMSALTDRYGVTLANLQDVLLGRPALLGEGELTSVNVGKFLITPLGGATEGYAVYSQISKGDIQYNYVVNPVNASDISVRLFSITPPDMKSVAFTYSNPTSTPAGWLPRGISFGLPTPSGKDLVVELEWGMPDAEWNSARQINWRRPAGYRESNAANLLEMIRQR